jgi:hypothetical protein
VSLRAPSMASVPLLMKNEFWRSPGVISATSRASAPRQGSSYSWLFNAMRGSCVVTA